MCCGTFNVVTFHLKGLKVAQVVQDLAAIARGIIAKDQGQEDPSTSDLVVDVHRGAQLRDLTASFALADPR